MAARGGEDEMMRVIFVAEQKRWEKSLERGAPTVATILEEEAEDMTEESYGDYEEELERMARMAELQEDFVPNHGMLAGDVTKVLNSGVESDATQYRSRMTNSTNTWTEMAKS